MFYTQSYPEMSHTDSFTVIHTKPYRCRCTHTHTHTHTPQHTVLHLNRQYSSYTEYQSHVPHKTVVSTKPISDKEPHRYCSDVGSTHTFQVTKSVMSCTANLTDSLHHPYLKMTLVMMILVIITVCELNTRVQQKSFIFWPLKYVENKMILYGSWSFVFSCMLPFDIGYSRKNRFNNISKDCHLNQPCLCVCVSVSVSDATSVHTVYSRFSN